jgi:hypothetical protein
MPNIIEMFQGQVPPELEGVSFVVNGGNTLEATIEDPSKLPNERLLLSGETDRIAHSLTAGLRFKVTQNGVSVLSVTENTDPRTLTLQFSYFVLDVLEGKRERTIREVKSVDYPFY